MTTPARPLVVRFGALGDMVVLTVAIRLLHRRYGVPVDVLSSGAWTRPLLAGQSGVGTIYLLRRRSSPFWVCPRQWRVLWALRRRGAGPAWLFDVDNRKASWLLQCAGWQPQQLLMAEDMPHISGEAFCDRWRRFALLGPTPDGTSMMANPAEVEAEAVPSLQVSAQSRAELRAYLQRRGLIDRRLILVQTGNKRTMRRGSRRRRSNTKYWPEAHWAAVVQALRALHPGHALVLLGVRQEAALNAEILSLACITNAYNLAGEVPVPQLLALAERAFAMMSVDTGPAHVAAAVGCPVLVLYDRPSMQRIYAPRARGAPVLYLTGGTDEAPSLMGITPEQAVEAWQELVEHRERVRNPADGACGPV